ncbi:monooxygenase [Sphingobium sp. SCG-1]|uniref:flavin-containing monooxygenase n=1 Tax=Sphingobium sp. SCG-1 TaxID=2072936 RepID=UPI000CD6A441|nr:NAD(P)/FAD-dependent oxidoreductase [Sphingobium sp. SCG-1]AUW57426.1 monooxygenase [Sphingobium sp. SCG-1]
MSGHTAYDAKALHTKYLEERDKRLRKDGDAQFIEASGDYADYVADPYVEPGFARQSLTEEIDVLIVGGGFGGLLTGAELTRHGIESFRIVEVAGDFGGTWYWNRYPGVRCDIEAAIYMPLVEEVGTVPTEKYARGAEIFAHAQAIGRHFNLYDRALFQTKIDTIAWDENRARWIAETDRGDTLAARFVCVAQGPLAKVKLPRIPGIRSFKGHMFHSARWDYSYTGGSPAGGFDKLRGRRVGVIGTGATAVQIAPRLADDVAELLVFQRTPSAVDHRKNGPTDPDWFGAQEKGWQRRRMENFLAVVSGHKVEENLVNDHWGDLWLRFSSLMAERFQPGGDVGPHELMQIADYEKMEQIRNRVASEITDADLAERLKPWYNFLCKRPLYSDEFLPIFNRPNVTLIDTEGRGIESISERGVIAKGVEYPLDLIVLATGFDVGAPPHKVGGYQVRGRNGITLEDKWNGSFRSVHGTQLSGFPNFHIIGGTLQGTTAFNFTHTLLMQAEHAAALIARCRAQGVQTMEVTPEAELRWTETIDQKHVDHEHFYEECTPGFLNNEGKFADKPTYVGATYGGGPLEYEQVIAEWRREHVERDTKCTR